MSEREYWIKRDTNIQKKIFDTLYQGRRYEKKRI